LSDGKLDDRIRLMEKEYSERTILLDQRVERLEDHYSKHEDILFNKGQGLLFKLDRLDQASKRNDKDDKKFQWNITTIINIMIAIANIIMLILQR
jgi:hypothetical protein